MEHSYQSKFPSDVSLLDPIELEYEFHVRGLPSTEITRNRVALLQQAIQLEESNAQPAPIKLSNDESTFDTCAERLRELEKFLKQAVQTGNEEQIKALKARIRHYLDRAARSSDKEENTVILWGIVCSIERVIRRSASSQSSTNSKTTSNSPNTTIVGATQGAMGRGRGVPTARAGSIPPNSIRPTGTIPKNGAVNPVIGIWSDVSHTVTQSDLVNESERLKLETARFNPSSRSSQPNISGASSDEARFREALQFRDAPEPVRTPTNRLQIEQPSNSQPRAANTNSIHKWRFEFSGEDGLSLNDFITNIELYTRANQIAKEEVVHGIFHLLRGRALEWYKANFNQIHNWDSLVVAMKKEFLPLNYDYMIREEIMSRIQQPAETFATYIIAMQKLFQRCYPPLDEEYKIYILRRNMLPQYSVQVAMFPITSVSQLQTLCKQLDEAKLLDSRRRLMPTIQNPLEPSCFPTAIPSRNLRQCATVEHEVVQVDTQKHYPNRYERPPRFQRKRTDCWNCRKPGHRHFDCKEPIQNLFCFCCGKVGVSVQNCPENHEAAKQQVTQREISSSNISHSNERGQGNYQRKA